MKLLDTTTRLYSPGKADELAAELQAGDEEGWTYTAVHDPKGTGYSYIAVYDENGEFIDNL